MWTSPVPSLSGIRYYVLFLDQFSHFLWVYPLRKKSEVFSKFLNFHSYVKNRFNANIKSLQCDNGGEYNNSMFHEFLAEQGITFRFSCPYTSQQNGKSEHMIRTINNALRTLLIQAHLPTTFWVEALHYAVHVLNLLPSISINNKIPFSIIFQKDPSYTHLKVFDSLCFPHTNNQNKLEPKSTPSIFLGFPILHSGYRCFDLKTRKIILSRHVTFNEYVFPYKQLNTNYQSDYDFLQDKTEPSTIQKQFLLSPSLPAANIKPPVQNEPPQNPSSNVTAPVTRRVVTRSQLGIHKPKQILSLSLC